eukprot:scaffold3666_cov160-Amphora_coffeaeformis.AAC.14
MILPHLDIRLSCPIPYSDIDDTNISSALIAGDSRWLYVPLPSAFIISPTKAYRALVLLWY